MQRKPLVIGNWKMHKAAKESAALASEIANATSRAHADVGVAPVFTSLAAVHARIGESRLLMGAQNCHSEDQGAFTGEISVPMLKDAGCEFVLIGHSERRQFFGDTNETVAKRFEAALRHELLPVLCVGESLAQREAGQTQAVVLEQLRVGMQAATKGGGSPVFVVAYEPVWAIGTGRTATPNDAQDVHAAIRECLTAELGVATAQATRILYGGSVNAENAKTLFGQPDIDGGLVGGASLKADTFVAIVTATG